jgi:putative NADH-flavin reductase
MSPSLTSLARSSAGIQRPTVGTRLASRGRTLPVNEPSEAAENPKKKNLRSAGADSLGAGSTRNSRRVMRLAVLGATGSIGRELVAQALAADHEVTALVRGQRNPDGLDQRVALVVGDATNAADVKRAVDGSDAVINALGHTKGSPDDILLRATESVIAAMHANGVDRLVVLSSPAVVDSADRPGFRYRAARVLLRVVIPAVVRDHRAQARVIEESDLAWTIVRGPLVFTDGPRTGRYHAGPVGHHSGLRISRADLAEFMLETSTNSDFVRTKPLVSE